VKLLWLDLETTGLDPARGKILEVAAAVADLSAPFDLGPMYWRVLPLGTWEHAPLMDDYVRSMHTKSGLLGECERAGGSTVALAEAAHPRRAALAECDLLAMLPEPGSYEREDTPTLAGSSVHFDHGWLRVHMPTLAARLSHRHYDVSAVKLFCQSLGMPKLPRAEAHRAQADVRESVAHAQVCAKWLLANR
jgi:oligoribonuclease